VCVLCVCVVCVCGVCVVCVCVCVCVCVSQVQQIVSNSFQVFRRNQMRCLLQYLCVIKVQTSGGHNLAGSSLPSLVKFRCVQNWTLRVFKTFSKINIA